ncbi:MAG: hypothetical protein QM692_22365 [Thermomicrobiales bacterium]
MRRVATACGVVAAAAALMGGGVATASAQSVMIPPINVVISPVMPGGVVIPAAPGAPAVVGVPVAPSLTVDMTGTGGQQHVVQRESTTVEPAEIVIDE